jgi:hypothetical protein
MRFMKRKRGLFELFMVIMFTGIMIAGCGKSPDHKVVYQMMEKYLLVSKGQDSLAVDAKPLSANGRKEIIDWLNKVDFSNTATNQQKKLEVFRTGLIEVVDQYGSMDEAGFSEKMGELTMQMAIILKEFNLSGKKAKKAGFPDLAEPIDSLVPLAGFSK